MSSAYRGGRDGTPIFEGDFGLVEWAVDFDNGYTTERTVDGRAIPVLTRNPTATLCLDGLNRREIVSAIALINRMRSEGVPDTPFNEMVRPFIPGAEPEPEPKPLGGRFDGLDLSS